MKEKIYYTLEKAFLTLKNEEDVTNFLKDLCTPTEIKDMRERWKICQMLKEGEKSYQKIHEETNVSITTIGRVARFLLNESYQGYQKVLHTLGVKSH